MRTKLFSLILIGFCVISQAQTSNPQDNNVDLVNNTNIDFTAALLSKSAYSCGNFPVASQFQYDVLKSSTNSAEYVVDEDGNYLGYCNLGGMSLNVIYTTFTGSISLDFCINGSFQWSGSKNITLIGSGGQSIPLSISWSIPAANFFGQKRCVSASTAVITIN